MRKLFSVLALLFVGLSLNGQNRSYEWSKVMGGTSLDRGYSVTTDLDENIYITGDFSESVDFDPGVGETILDAGVNSDAFIQKLDPNGDLIWVKQLDINSASTGYSVETDGSGNVYITGSFHLTGDFDPGSGVYNLSSLGGSDIFVLKLDSNGNFVWAKAMGGTQSNIAFDLALDTNGNVYTTGYFRNTVDFNPGAGVYQLHSNGERDCFVQKLDINGNFLWAKQIGGDYIDMGYSIDTDLSGNVYTTGRFYNTVDFDPGIDTLYFTSHGLFDIYLQKLDTDGNLLWAKQMGGSGHDIGNHISVDINGNIYTIGDFTETVDFNPDSVPPLSLVSAGIKDIYIQKLTTHGSVIWAKRIGGIGIDQGYGLDLDQYGSVYITGRFSEIADFDPGTAVFELTPLGYEDIFIEKLDANGNFIWVEQMGGIGRGWGLNITVDNNSNIYSTGWFYSTVDFDPSTSIDNHISAGDRDIYVHKLSQCQNESLQEVNACNTYTWIDNNTYTEDSTIVYHLFGGSANGCDSIITLNVTINSISDTNVIVSGNVLSATNNNASFQWLDCMSNTPISGEINQSFTPTNNGEYALEITENGCVDTTSCMTINNISIGEFYNNIIAYPNPVKDYLTVDLNKTVEKVTIKLFDTTGRLINQFTQNNSDKFDIHINGQSGMYLLQIESLKETQVIMISKL